VNGESPKRNQRVYNPKSGRHIEVTLNRAVKMWPTVTVNTSKNCSEGINWEMRLKKSHLDGVMHQVEGSGSLNPTWVEWLMGFPLGWTDLKV
jgi:hypothetical protein